MQKYGAGVQSELHAARAQTDVEGKPQSDLPKVKTTRQSEGFQPAKHEQRLQSALVQEQFYFDNSQELKGEENSNKFKVMKQLSKNMLMIKKVTSHTG